MPTCLRPLMSGLDADLTVEDNALESVFGIKPTPFREAASKAISEGNTDSAGDSNGQPGS